MASFRKVSKRNLGRNVNKLYLLVITWLSQNLLIFTGLPLVPVAHGLCLYHGVEDASSKFFAESFPKWTTRHSASGFGVVNRSLTCLMNLSGVEIGASCPSVFNGFVFNGFISISPRAGWLVEGSTWGKARIIMDI